MADYDFEMSLLLDKIRRRFAEINRDDNLTEADKKQLKDFFLQNMVAPETRKLLEKHFPNGFSNNSGTHHRMTPADRRGRDAMRNSPQPNSNPPNRPASPDRNNTPDR